MPSSNFEFESQTQVLCRIGYKMFNTFPIECHRNFVDVPSKCDAVGRARRDFVDIGTTLITSGCLGRGLAADTTYAWKIICETNYRITGNIVQS